MQEKETKDRLLGDEWEGWSGDLIEGEKEINESPALFLKLYFLTILVLWLVLLLAYYLISPRLKTINIYLDFSVLVLFIIIPFIFTIHFLSVSLVVLFKKNFFNLKNNRFEIFIPVIYKLGEIFKISRDRIGNSYIKLNNLLIYLSKIKTPYKRLLILLPRCLEKGIKEKVMEIVNKYNCKVFIATGGSSARQVVKKEKPDAIIGVACERDLVSGIKDTSQKISIIAIENKRPEGPCKNTTLNISEFEKAIQYFLNIK